MTKAYYNDSDPNACRWLEALMSAGLIMDGKVDSRSIEDVQPEDLKGFTRCHFFAGIGGWERALQLAGWPDDRPVWTGSCPCTKVSAAQMYEPLNDPTNCWPNFLRLIQSEKPDAVFGEQSASKDGIEWLDGVWGQMEDSGYTFWPTVLCAAGVGAPHLRHRTFWLGHANREGLEGHTWDEDIQPEPRWFDPETNGPHAEAGVHNHWTSRSLVIRSEPAKSLAGRKVEKRSRIQPGTFPVADGLPGRVAQLRGLGNAIVPQVAAEFIGAYLDVCSTPQA